jgi:chromosome segregation ATPase
VSAAARGTLDRLHARVDELAASLREELGAVQTRVGTLGESVEGIGAGTVRGEELQQAIAESDARFADRLAQYDEAIAVLRRRLEEISVADGMLAERLGGIEAGLRAHVDERLGAIAADTNASRETLEGLRARLSGVERQTWSTPDTIDALRAELASLAERLTVVESAADWQNAMMGLDSRLHVVEETLATPDRSVETRLDELARRLDAEASQADERTRATERALRKGLTALGQQLAESEAVYTDAGNALRRSIERLGRAIVETDARISSREEQVEIGPRVDVGSYVAFVPTADGYRLVPVDGSAPQTGAVLQLEDHGQQLVVTRIGVSPIPLDERPCVYLEPLGGDASC